MKKNYFLIIISLLFTFTVLSQNSQIKNKRHHPLSKQLKNYGFNQRNNSERISHFTVNNRQKSSLKHKAEKKKKLDSTISIGTDGYDHGTKFIYNNDGYLIIEIRFDRENSNQWDFYSKNEYTYDSNGNITSIVDSYSNNYTNQWEFDNKEEYTYDANIRLTIKIEYSWNSSTNQWEIYDKDEYSYDSNGNLTQIVDYDWNTSTNQWDIHYKEEYSYDSNGNVTQIVDYDWNTSTNQWDIHYKDELFYDITYSISDLVLPSLFYSDSFAFRIEYMLTKSISYNYNNQNWEEGHETTLYYSDISNSNTICENLSITNSTYSETEDLNQKVKDELGDAYAIADWNDLKNISNLDDWVTCLGLNHNDTFMLTRNGNFIYSGNRQYYVHYSTDGIPYSGFTVHDQVGDFYLGSWYGLNMNILAKNNNALAVGDIDLNKNFNIYPNPVNNNLFIQSDLQITKVEIYSILGKKVKEFKTNLSSVSTQDLFKGIYLLRIESENGFVVKKLIKQ